MSGAGYNQAGSSGYNPPVTFSGNSSSSSSSVAATSGNSNVATLQSQVDQVVDIMRVNVSKVLERDEKLTELDSRAENLADGSRQFQATAHRVKRKYWWQNCKMWFILIGVIVVIVVVLIIVIAVTVQSNKSIVNGISNNNNNPSVPSTVTPTTRNR